MAATRSGDFPVCSHSRNRVMGGRLQYRMGLAHLTGRRFHNPMRRCDLPPVESALNSVLTGCCDPSCAPRWKGSALLVALPLPHRLPPHSLVRWPFQDQLSPPSPQHGLTGDKQDICGTPRVYVARIRCSACTVRFGGLSGS